MLFGQTVWQVHCVIFDTKEGSFLLTERKIQKIMRDLSALRESEWYSRTEAAEALGKLVN